MTPLKYVFGLILVFFLDAVRRTVDMQNHLKETKDHPGGEGYATMKDHQVKLFRAQRNMYIAGTTVVLLLVLNRLYSLSRDLMRSQAKYEAMEKQAKNAASFAASLLEDDKKGDKKKGGETKKSDAEEDFPAVPEKKEDATGTVKESTGLRSRSKKD